MLLAQWSPNQTGFVPGIQTEPPFRPRAYSEPSLPRPIAAMGGASFSSLSLSWLPSPDSQHTPVMGGAMETKGSQIQLPSSSEQGKSLSDPDVAPQVPFDPGIALALSTWPDSAPELNSLEIERELDHGTDPAFRTGKKRGRKKPSLPSAGWMKFLRDMASCLGQELP